MTVFPSLLLFIALLFFLTDATEFPPDIPDPAVRPCYTRFLRHVGALNWYMWACACLDTSGRSIAKGRVILDGPKGSRNTLGRFIGAVKCFDHIRSKFGLDELCEKDFHRWEHFAKFGAKRCAHKPLKPPEAALTGPMTYNREHCTSRVVNLRNETSSETISLCLCFQKQFLLHPRTPYVVVQSGRAAFDSNVREVGSDEEQKSLNECKEDVMKQLTDVCTRTPRNFNILARQLLEVCCKRARRFTTDLKFECRSITGDDLSDLDVPV